MQNVFRAQGSDWQTTGGMLPTSHRLSADRIRVYIAFLDSQNIGRIGYIDVDAHDPKNVLNVSDEPVLDVGAPGTFDEHGVNPSSIIEVDGDLLLYYVGWQRLQSLRYTLFTGLAKSTDGGDTFQRVSESPMLDRTDGERYFRTAAHVLYDDDEDIYRMWYIGGDDWIDRGDGSDKRTPLYSIRYLESDDPTEWRGQGEVVLDYGLPITGYGAPYVMKDGDEYCCWYSVRHRTRDYIAIEETATTDPTEWTRGDVVLEPSNSGWDSEMVCFPDILPFEDGSDRHYLFYNGNGFGRSGVGVALGTSTETP